MTGSEKNRSKGTDWLSILSFGFFLVLFGTIWMITPNFTGEVSAFITDFHLENVTEHVVFPAPEHEFNHQRVYTTTMQFCFIFGAFQIIILALRFVLHESLDRKSGTISGTVFWLSAGFFLNMLVNEAVGWFGFLAGLMISVGLAIITSSLVKLFR